MKPNLRSLGMVTGRALGVALTVCICGCSALQTVTRSGASDIQLNMEIVKAPDAVPPSDLVPALDDSPGGLSWPGW